jgi:hypothetical protein
MRLTSFCTRVRVYTTRGRNWIAAVRSFSSTLLFPSKAMRLMMGLSTTLMTNVLPARLKLTSAKSPVATKAFSDLSTDSSSQGSPGWMSR